MALSVSSLQFSSISVSALEAGAYVCITVIETFPVSHFVLTAVKKHVLKSWGSLAHYSDRRPPTPWGSLAHYTDRRPPTSWGGFSSLHGQKASYIIVDIAHYTDRRPPISL